MTFLDFLTLIGMGFLFLILFVLLNAWWHATSPPKSKEEFFNHKDPKNLYDYEVEIVDSIKLFLRRFIV